MSGVKPERLREAREYLGFTREDVAGAMGWDAARLAALEDGAGGRLTGEELRKLSRLYRRPVAWLSGEDTFRPGGDLLRQVEPLSEHDREAVLDFAEFLQGAGPPPPVVRKMQGG